MILAAYPLALLTLLYVCDGVSCWLIARKG
jgi:hypothetical protein